VAITNHNLTRRACLEVGNNDHSLYRRRKEYGGLKLELANT